MGSTKLAAIPEEGGLAEHDLPPQVGPHTSPGPAPSLDIDALLDDPAPGIIVCRGSGGVGKTTTSAALASRAAERGTASCLPSILHRQSMGIERLDNVLAVVGLRHQRQGQPARRCFSTR